MKLIEKVKHTWWPGVFGVVTYLSVATLVFYFINSRPGQPSKNGFDILRDWLAIVGGGAGLIGGILAFVSTYRPVSVQISHLDSLGLVIANNGTIPKLHLPVVISNLSKRPGAISSMRLSAKPPNGKWHTFKWEVFWREDENQRRTRERGVVPIPLQPFNCAERSIGFVTEEPMKLEPALYEFELEVVLYPGGPFKKVARFVAQPTQEICNKVSWGHGKEMNYVEHIPICTYEADLLASKDLQQNKAR